MLIFLYGEDTYRSCQKLNQIKEKAKKLDPRGLNIIVFERENLEFSQLKKAIEMVPFLVRRKLVIVKNIFFSNENLKKKVANFLQKNKIPDSTVLVFWESSLPDKKEDLFKILIKNADQFENFTPLFGIQLKDWVEKIVKKYGGRIRKDAVNLLVNFVGNNLWRMENEIKKLILFKINEKSLIIRASDVESLVRVKLEDNIFDFIDAILSKNKKLALKLLHNQVELGENEIYLLAMITYQFRNMILVSDLAKQKINQYQIAKETKLHPYVVKKILQNINKFKISQLSVIYRKLLEVDINLKKTTQNHLLLLDMLVNELCK